MPTVKLKGGKDKVFPYNAMGKAQAHHYAKMHGGKVKNNPGYGMEKKNEIIILMARKKRMQNPCWKGFIAYGMKMKNGKKVPNCVPKKK